MADELRVVLNMLGEEVPYVLREHRDEETGEPRPGAPVFYYRPLSLGEQAAVEDNLVRAAMGKPGTDDEEPEMRVLSGTQERRVLLSNLLRAEGVEIRTGSGEERPLELPAPRRYGADYPERERMLNILPRPWRRELARAILDDARLPEPAEKN